jgi:hypothetical protein
MRQLMKRFLWVGLLAFGLQTSRGFSLLGPVANSPEDNFQVPEIGYSPNAGLGPPWVGDLNRIGPKNLGEGYRLNTPVMYYTFDPSFGYFGSNGEVAVQQAFDMMNTLSNVDSYSANLSEFPLNAQSENYTAYGLGMYDLKSTTLSLLLEQMGLADAVRYTWALIDRYNPPGSTCPSGGPAIGYDYFVIQRNYDIIASPLNQLQYSAYVNGELYSYYVYDNCDAPGASPPTADALEIPADPINKNSPVASGLGEDVLPIGFFYTGLTRDDVAGLRYLLSTNNIFAPSAGYMESSAGGSVVVSGGGSGTSSQFQLTTFSLAILPITDPVTLQTEVPGIVITSVTTNTVIANGQTNYTYTYTFGNLVTNSFSTNTMVITQVQTTTISPFPVYGQPYPPVYFRTNTTPPTTTTNISSMVSGDFYVVPTNSCGLTVLATLSNIVVGVTNNLGAVTNVLGPYSSNIVSTSIITFSTNHVLLVNLCTFSTNGTTNSSSVVGDFQGIGRVQFVRVSDGNYDYQTGQFYNPVTNQYSMVLTRSGQASTVVFQRVVTRPDILFMGANMSVGGNDVLFLYGAIGRSTPNFINSRAAANLSGPGIIDPTTAMTTITYNTVGPIYENTSPTSLTGPDSSPTGDVMIWGSFDGTTNAPVVYPNGTSITNLAAEALIRISPPPPTLPDGTNGVPYNVTLSATGGQPSYTWSLTANSAGLPPGLTLSAGGVISGTPTNCITSTPYDNIVIQMTDSSYPVPLSVDTTYSITIYP